MNVIPDRVIAWNEEMKEDFLRLHDIPEDEIHIGGALYFD